MSWFKSKKEKVKPNVTVPVAPPVVTNQLEPITFTGDYSTWQSAAAVASGYHSIDILEKTRVALLKVKNKEAAYERDSVLFDKIEFSFPILAGLLRVALLNNGRLSVADFGGSLGSSYFQCRAFLHGVTSLKWNVIEQVGHVECGRREFETDELRFHFNMKDLPEVPDVLLLSNVLAYLPCPQETLKELLSYGCNHLLIDETPFIVGEGDRLTVQKVPEYIYKASYPAWFFNETKTLKTIESFGYHLITDFDCKYSYSPDGAVGYYKGFIYDKRQTELESTTISEKTSPGNP